MQIYAWIITTLKTSDFELPFATDFYHGFYLHSLLVSVKYYALLLRSLLRLSICDLLELWVNRRIFAANLITPHAGPGIWLRCDKKQWEHIRSCFSTGCCYVEAEYEKLWFPANISLYLGNDASCVSSYNGQQIGTHMRFIEWRHFTRPSVNPNQH